MSVVDAGLSARPNGRALSSEAREHGCRQQAVRGQPARAGEEPERRIVLHDVLVITCAGRLTTWTAGRRLPQPAARRGADAATLAICARRSFSSPRYFAQRTATTFWTSFASVPQLRLAYGERAEPRIGVADRPRMGGDDGPADEEDHETEREDVEARPDG